jgi:hypothetical protein
VLLYFSWPSHIVSIIWTALTELEDGLELGPCFVMLELKHCTLNVEMQYIPEVSQIESTLYMSKSCLFETCITFQ